MSFSTWTKRKLHALQALSWHDRWILLQAWSLLLIVDLALRLLPFRWVQGWAAQEGGVSQRGHGETATRRLEIILRIAANHHLYPMKCLRCSLVLQRLLSRRGTPTTLRFGVRQGAGELNAHAWLECDGRPVGEQPGVDAHYSRLLAARPIKQPSPYRSSLCCHQAHQQLTGEIS
jgi:hypothetical protein